MKKAIYRVAIWWILSVWSPLYRFFLEGGKRVEVKPQESIGVLVNRLNRVGWRKDGILQLWDAIGHPERMQWLMDEGKSVEVGSDCDEHASYSWCSLTISEVQGLEEVLGIMTVGWWKPWFWKFKRFGGHHVCLVKYEGKYAHVGNWGFVKGFESQEDVIRNVLGDHEFFGWFMWRYPTTLLDYDVTIR